MKKLFIALVCVAVLVLLMVVCMSAIAKTTRYTWGPWYWTDNFPAGTPLAQYYGEAVYVNYESYNAWTVNQEPGTVDVEGAVLRQRLVQRGTAKIYAADDDELLETREFVCHEQDVDENIDNGVWDGTWYIAFAKGWADLEFFNYKWMIVGRYTFQAQVKNGVATIWSEWGHPIAPPNK